MSSQVFFQASGREHKEVISTGTQRILKLAINWGKTIWLLHTNKNIQQDKSYLPVKDVPVILQTKKLHHPPASFLPSTAVTHQK